MCTINFFLALAIHTNIFVVDYIKFEELLGKHISVAETVIGDDFSETSFKSKKNGVKYYSNSEYLRKLLDYELKDYFGMPCINLFIQTDKNDIVQSINIFFHKSIDRQFYDMFNTVYGQPTSILIIDKRTVISESSAKDDPHGFNQHVRKSELELREGTFEEGPLYIIWEKGSYKVKALFRQQNMSEITFSIRK